VPYPTQWAQIIVQLPAAFPVYGGDSINPVCCLHFTYSPALPVGFSYYIWSLAIDAWVTPWLKRLVYDYAASDIVYQTYVNVPPGGVVNTLLGGFSFFNVAAVLPGTHCVVMRLEATGYGKRNCGRKFLSTIRASFTKDGVLTNAGAVQASAAAALMLAPLVSQGVTFTLVIPSFADGAAKPVVRVRFDYRLGLVKRRGRQKSLSSYVGTTPFDLPP
jgi:hypothetical protein